MKKDSQLTAAAGFADPRSYVAPDHREILFGADWLERKKQLWERCRGRCEQRVRLDRITPGDGHCGAIAQDPHHITKRSVKRDDRLANLLALCRYHHDLLDSRKPRFGEKAAGRP